MEELKAQQPTTPTRDRLEALRKKSDKLTTQSERAYNNGEYEKEKAIADQIETVEAEIRDIDFDLIKEEDRINSEYWHKHMRFTV